MYFTKTKDIGQNKQNMGIFSFSITKANMPGIFQVSERIFSPEVHFSIHTQ